MIAAMVLVLAGCSGQTSVTASKPSPTPSASVVSAGCGSTAVVFGGIPKWLDDAGGHNNPGYLPYVIAHPQIAAGFIFSYPLKASQTEHPNKILWVVRSSRNGAPLLIDGHPLGATSPSVHDERPANSGPGEIYPSGTDVPSAGCWQFDLHWGPNHAQVELNYVVS